MATSAVAAVSAVVITAGASLALSMLLGSGDFEGYVVLIGLVLAGQGVVVLGDAIASRHVAASVLEPRPL